MVHLVYEAEMLTTMLWF